MKQAMDSLIPRNNTSGTLKWCSPQPHGIVVDEAIYNTMKAAVDPCTTLIATKCNQGDSFFDDFACQSAFWFATWVSPSVSNDGSQPTIFLKSASTLCSLTLATCKVPQPRVDTRNPWVWMKHSHSWTECNFGLMVRSAPTG
jgi:hypothetical protein